MQPWGNRQSSTISLINTGRTRHHTITTNPDSSGQSRSHIYMSISQQPTMGKKQVDIKHFAILKWTDIGHIKLPDTPFQYNTSGSLTKPQSQI
eukprot:scaffold10240_cov134-Cylindrotheca_fusiformis.AAC.2